MSLLIGEVFLNGPPVDIPSYGHDEALRNGNRNAVIILELSVHNEKALPDNPGRAFVLFISE